MIQLIDSKALEFSPHVQDYCRLPYPGHPRGCPNYGMGTRSKKRIPQPLRNHIIDECPPTDLLLDDVFDFSEKLFVIYTVFNIGEDAQRRMDCSTKLQTNAEFYNLRYWQQPARKALYEEVAGFLYLRENAIVDVTPEAHGLNVHKLMKHFKVHLPWKPYPPVHSLDNIRYRIAIGGTPKDSSTLQERGLL